VTPPQTYAVITPARDEAEHLPRLAASLVAQTHPPRRWIVVENRSADDTLAVAHRLANDLPWMQVVASEPISSGARGAPVVQAFHAGLDALDVPVDVVAKVDADVSVDNDYFERLLAALADDPQLGLASGTCYESFEGVLTERHVTGDHVWGAARAYRLACLEDVLPLEERMGWDGIDVVKAHTHGWRTATFRDLPFRHNRREGKRDGSRWAAWTAQGRAARYMRYRPSYLVLRTVHRVVREPAALAILWGYLQAVFRREPRCSDTAIVARVREGQRLRRLPVRARQALGI
jgi:glycosyltransferase involved in cell wall biosynthesis